MSKKSRKRNYQTYMKMHNNTTTRNNTKTGNNTKKEDTKMTSNIETLDAAILERDYTYQRPLNMSRIRQIAAAFDADVVNILKVSFRDGHYYVFDGSHTLEALRYINGKEHFPVVCKVYKCLTYEREAELFAKQTGNAARVGMLYKLRALELAGDEATVHFLEVTRSCGFDIDPGEIANKKNRIAAICKAYSVYQSLGDEMYKDMLTLMKDTWNGETWSVSHNMLSGMAIFYRTYLGKFKKERFINKLSVVSRTEIQKEAGKHPELPAGYRFAYAFATIYNHKSGSGSLKLKYLTLYMIEEEDKGHA